MACVTPVVTSGFSSLPEVTGGAALLFDPNDQHPLANAFFPYTTLFRSAPVPLYNTFHEVWRVSGILGRTCGTARIPENRQDRKSTRLNSSHANSSYSAFSLKKNKGFRVSYALRGVRTAAALSDGLRHTGRDQRILQPARSHRRRCPVV